jgi:hypothetical protein
MLQLNTYTERQVFHYDVQLLFTGGLSRNAHGRSSMQVAPFATTVRTEVSKYGVWDLLRSVISRGKK